jgi:hypothetical protein
MAFNPDLRVFVGSGLYDIATTFFAAEHATASPKESCPAPSPARSFCTSRAWAVSGEARAARSRGARFAWPPT